MNEDYEWLIKKSIVKENGCIEYHGRKVLSKKKYNLIKILRSETVGDNETINVKVLMLAHRASWSFHYGEIPEGMLICHKCDNPPCVNIDHLFLGTPKDNIQDAIKKGRFKPSEFFKNRKNFNKYEIFDIRNRNNKYRELCEKYNISITTVHSIRSFKTYKNI